MSQIPPPIPPAQYPASELPPVNPGPLRGGLRPHRGGLILGLGIGSLGVWFLSMIGALVFACCGVSWLISLGMAIPAWIMASTDLAAMDAGTMDSTGRGSTQGGKVCAIVSVVIHGISFLVTILLVVLGIAILGAGLAGGAAGRP